MRVEPRCITATTTTDICRPSRDEEFLDNRIQVGGRRLCLPVIGKASCLTVVSASGHFIHAVVSPSERRCGSLTKSGDEAKQVAIRILHQKLMHPGLHRSRAIPFLFRGHKQRPIRIGKRLQDRIEAILLCLEELRSWA